MALVGYIHELYRLFFLFIEKAVSKWVFDFMWLNVKLQEAYSFGLPSRKESTCALHLRKGASAILQDRRELLLL